MTSEMFPDEDTEALCQRIWKACSDHGAFGDGGVVFTRTLGAYLILTYGPFDLPASQLESYREMMKNVGLEIPTPPSKSQ